MRTKGEVSHEVAQCGRVKHGASDAGTKAGIGRKEVEKVERGLAENKTLAALTTSHDNKHLQTTSAHLLCCVTSELACSNQARSEIELVLCGTTAKTVSTVKRSMRMSGHHTSCFYC